MDEALAWEFEVDHTVQPLMGRCLFRIMGFVGSGKTLLIRRTYEVLGGRIPFQIAYRNGFTDEKDARYLEAIGLSTHVLLDLDEQKDMEFQLWPLLPKGGAVFFEERSQRTPRLRFGHELRIWVQSVVGGDRLPDKYPETLREVDLVVLNHIDLLPFTEFSFERFRRELRMVNPEAEYLGVSCRTGVGLEFWRDWILTHMGLPPKETGAKE